MDLYKLKSFDRVAQLQSVSRAAEQLFLTQPAVSAHIKDLEYEYGTKLFDRIGRNIKLTKAGESLLPYVKSILDTFDESHFAVDMLKDQEKGSIRLGTSNLPGARFVPDCLASFLKKHPLIQFSIDTTTTQNILNLIKQQKLELGIIGSSDEKLNKPELVCKTLFRDEVVLAVSREHPLAERESIKVHELANLPVIASLKNTVTRQAIDKFFHKFSVPCKIAYEISNKSMIKNMVEKNLGISFFSRLEIHREIEMNWLKMLIVEEAPVYRYILVVNHKNRDFSPSLQLFYDFLFDCWNPDFGHPKNQD